MSLLFIIYDLQSVTSFKHDSEAMRAERETHVYLSLEQCGLSLIYWSVYLCEDRAELLTVDSSHCHSGTELWELSEGSQAFGYNQGWP